MLARLSGDLAIRGLLEVDGIDRFVMVRDELVRDDDLLCGGIVVEKRVLRFVVVDVVGSSVIMWSFFPNRRVIRPLSVRP